MFKKKRSQADAVTIPADLFATIQSPRARRKRWIIEILISLVIVGGLLVGGMWLYKTVRHHSEPSSVPKSHSERVTQSPQPVTETQDSTDEPAETPASDSTNDTTLPMPN